MFLCDEKCESVKIFPRWLVCCIRISFVSVWLTPWWTLYLLLILTLFFPSPASSCFLISVTIHTLPLMTTQWSKPPQQLKISLKDNFSVLSHSLINLWGGEGAASCHFWCRLPLWYYIHTTGSTATCPDEGWGRDETGDQCSVVPGVKLSWQMWPEHQITHYNLQAETIVWAGDISVSQATIQPNNICCCDI